MASKVPLRYGALFHCSQASMPGKICVIVGSDWNQLLGRDIFISYAHEDRSFAQALAQTLSDRGWSLFWDPGLKPR
jgi:TIR domain